MKKICEWCNKEFEAIGRNAARMRFCSDVHYQTCAVCGKVFVIKSMYDVPKCCSAECTKKLRKMTTDATMLKKYGVTHYTQVPEFREKARKTRAEHQEETSAKTRATMLEHYGVEYAMQSKELQQKAAATNLERYGVANPAQNAEIRKKISEAVSSEACQERYCQTSLEHYGVEYPAQSAEVQNKMKATCLERYGVEHVMQHEEVKQRMIQNAERTRILHPEISTINKQRIHEACLEKYGVDWFCQLKQCREAAHQTISQANRAIGTTLTSMGCDVAYELSLGPYSYDIAIPSQKIAIEVNPSYTHNTEGNHYGVVRTSDYHLKKTQVAIDGGYRCVHIFDWDNVDKVLQLFSPKKLVYARKCKVQEIDAATASEFESLYHLQGAVRGQQLCLGLFCWGQLLEVMTFGRPRYNNKYDWELLRLCTATEYKVVGGANKLWAYFLKAHKNESVISYCDIAKFTGHVYAQLGMELLYTTPPSKIWSKGSQKITDNLLRQRGFDQLFDTDFGKGSSNEGLMLQHGWLPVYDCGQQVWIYEK